MHGDRWGKLSEWGRQRALPERRRRLGTAPARWQSPPVKGHAPGHVSVMIEGEGHSAPITGDMRHHSRHVAHPDWCHMLDSDPVAAVEKRARMFGEWADDGVLVTGTHYATPTAGMCGAMEGVLV